MLNVLMPCLHRLYRDEGELSAIGGVVREDVDQGWGIT
jgi:hypothetical protein